MAEKIRLLALVFTSACIWAGTGPLSDGRGSDAARKGAPTGEGRGVGAAAELGNLATAYYGRGDYRRAELLLQQVLPRLENESDNYASALNNLAAIYKSEARYAEAEALWKRALAIRERNGSSTSAQNATVLNNLGDLYLHMAQYGLADASARRALALRQALFGAQDMYVAQSMNLLAAILQATGRIPESLTLGRAALAAAERAANKSDEGIGGILITLGAGRRHSGDLRGADSYLTRALPLLEGSALRPVAFNEMGLAARSEGNSKRAAAMFERALALWKVAPGPEQPEYASGLENLGLVCQERRQFAKAQPLFLEALRIHEAKLGRNHPQVGNDLINLGQLACAQHKDREGQSFFERALATERQRGGPITSVTGFAEADLGAIAARHKSPGQAEELLEKAIRDLTATADENDSRLMAVYEELAAVSTSNHEFAAAEQAKVSAMRIRVHEAVLADR